MIVSKINEHIFSLAIILSIFILLPGCNNGREIFGTYVSSRNPSDSLFLSRDGTYARKTSAIVIDQGTWYVEGNDIWFSDWINRGEELELLGDPEPGLSGFTLRQSWLKAKNLYISAPTRVHILSKHRTIKLSETSSLQYGPQTFELVQDRSSTAVSTTFQDQSQKLSTNVWPSQEKYQSDHLQGEKAFDESLLVPWLPR